ncbi:MAG: hypothetical protein M1334_00385 [Patescibacteria group bacterium]|nr:hypothetical protein [Patescibacteria group bacterium]
MPGALAWGWSEGQKEKEAKMARSKKEVEAMVSAMGVFASLITDLVGFVKELGGTVENIYRLATPEGAETLKKVAEVIVREANNCLRLISGSELVINPTSGRVIADANDVFGYIGYNFREKADEAGKPTEETPVHIYEMTQDATLAQIFSDPDKMTLTQGQIIEFVEKYPEWFRQNDYAATLFFV